MNETLNEYARFHAAQVATNDLDPVYPVLQDIGRELTGEQALWLTFLHVAYYHMGSALAAFSYLMDSGNLALAASPSNAPLLPDDYLTLPCGTERRGHRDPRKLAMHLDALRLKAQSHGSLDAWLSTYLHPNKEAGWSAVNEALVTVWGNGRWAAYKTAEMLWKVNGLPIRATDMGHQHSSGPRHGLELLYPYAPQGNTPGEIVQLNILSDQLLRELKRRGYRAGVEEAETSLCDYHSYRKGNYYVGHDIDQMLAQLLAVPSRLVDAALASRRKHFPHAMLGELQPEPWHGVRKELKGTPYGLEYA